MAGHVLLKHRCVLVIWFMLWWTVSEQVNYPPRFRNIQKDTIASVPENARRGDGFFNVLVTDANGGPLTFTVTNPKGIFEFDQSSLRTSNPPITEFYINLTVTGNPPGLDFEKTQDYVVTLQVSDAQSRATADLKVKVLNANDNPPNLVINRGTVTINEMTPIGTSLDYSLTFSDTDTNDNVYVGLMGNDANIMNINPSTGSITLNSVIDLDPNTELRVFTPVVFASDGKLTSSATLTLTVRDINDNPPVCNPSSIQGEVQEEMPGSRVVGVFSCTDRDSAYNNNNRLSYTITQGDSSLFSVDSSGTVSVISPLDYEKRKTEVVTVRVEDQGLEGRLVTTGTVTVAVKPVNDISPVWGAWRPEVPSDLTYYVSENAPLGTSILTTFASDADLDVGNEVTYSMIVTSSGGSPQPGAISIDLPLSGLITPQPDTFSLDSLTGLFSTHSSLQRDGPNSVTQYKVIFQASDGIHVINRTINVVVKDVNDNAPRFVGVPYPVIVLKEEEAKAGALVTKVSAIDDDSTSTNLAFSVGAVLSGNTPLNSWRFNPSLLGQLELATNLDLDIDNPPSTVSVLRLFVRDNGVPELTGTATLTVRLIPDNEFSPIIVSQPGRNPVQIAEDTPVHTQIARIEALDQDKGQEGVLVYSITAGNTRNAFSIDASGGISTEIELDRETLGQYILNVLISDSAENDPRSVSTTVTIQVTDVDDNIPACPSDLQPVAILENAAVNTIVTTISCTDADSGDILTASVKPPLDTIFGFNSAKIMPRGVTSWELKLLQGVDYDSSNQSYAVETMVSDGKSAVTVKVTVSLTPVNEFRPTFQTNPTVTVPENVVKNPLIVYDATDLDYSPHNVVSYKINSVSNGGASLFNIESRTGGLLLLSALDYEALPAGDKSYRIVVIAEDGGGLQGTGTVTVSAEDANDNPPTCGHSLFFLQVSEKQSGIGPYNILSDLDCRDLEDGNNLNFSMTQSPGDNFALSNGGIQLKTNSLDYETSPAHTLIVRVGDNGVPSLTTTVTVYIAVNNENDGGPVFSPSSPINISEMAAIGQFVADLVAIDPDGNDPEFGDVQYSILSGDTQSHFFMDAQTGRLSTRKKLDFETIRSYNLLIQAKEKKGPNSAIMTQIVNLIDMNDEKPACAVLSFIVTVLESEAIDYTVVDLMCQDADAGTVLTYTILSGNTTNFKMQGSQLKLKTPLDFEILPITNDIMILVSDSVASHDLSVSGTVITGSVDEGPPKFDNATYMVHVSENQTVYSNIYTLTAKDPDSPRDQNGQVKYSFLVPYSLFSIDPQNGQIFLAGPLDREKEASHSLVVKAEDALRSSSVTLFVIVDDINDNPPRFKSSVYRGAIAGTDPVGTSVLTVQAIDADDPTFKQYGSVIYQLTGSPDFTINAATGVITNTVRMDTQNGSRFYSLTATAIDSGGAAGFLSSICVVNIQVTTSNRYAPIFTQPSYSVTVRENQFKMNDIILNVTAVDADSGLDGEFTLTLVSVETKFNLTQTGNTGQLRLQQNLDFDSGDTEFTFEVTATDKGTPPQTGTCIVTILVDDAKDEALMCRRYIYLDKVEGETFLTKIVCPGGDRNRTLSFTVNSTTPNSIQPTISKDGRLVTQVPLDYEISKLYQITIEAKDNGPPAMSMIINVRLRVIDVNDNDPTFKGPLAFDLLENTTAGSTVVYTVLADSNDSPSDKVTFTLVDSDYFYITPDTGEISLTASAPDYEIVGDIYTTVVCISDSPKPVVRTTCSNLTVHILDCNDELPKFSPQVYQVTVAEDAEVGRSLVTVAATDKDVSPKYRNITYFIREGNTDGCFRVTPDGLIDLIKMLDYERTQFYTLIVEASDGLYNTTAQCYITVSPVNEQAPVFPASSTTVHVEENVPSGTYVYTASASDPDGGNDGLIRYRMDPGPFVIDSQSGKVSVIGRLDRETIPSYNLKIYATDQGTNAKTGILLTTIIVDDVNDNAPTCDTSTYVVSVPESVTPDDTLVALSCVDDDDDPASNNNALSYTISSVPANVFIVDKFGFVKLKSGATLDRETAAAYTIDITVSDNGSKLRQTNDVIINLTVTDVNDNSPYLTSLKPVNVPENTPPGTVITTIEAADNDEGLNKQLIYQITGGNPGNIFSLNPTSGDLTLSKSLEFESSQQYQLLITVKDRGSPARSVTGTLMVTVSDVNDNPPKCPTAISPVTKLENSTNEFVLTVSCEDQDVTGNIVYSITDGNDGNFEINSDTGVISTKSTARLDYESVQSYVLEVTAFDGVYYDVVFIYVNIADVNEFRPKFVPPGPVTVFVPEDAEVNYSVYGFKATDQDTGDSVKLFYIVGGNSAQRFTLDDRTGKLQLQFPLDYEDITSYILTVAVYDSGNLNDTMELYISVTDVNDNAPTCQDKSVTLTVLEGARPNTIYKPLCTDADKKASPILEYILPAGSHRAFVINNSTGQLSLVEPLDYEADTVVLLTIVVREKGVVLPRETTINIQIIVDPVNEFDPVFQPTSSYGPYSIPENTVTGSLIVKVVASDADKGLSDGTVRYAISAGDPQEFFYIDETSGEIHLAQQVNREVLTEFNLIITASDSVPGSDRSRFATARMKLVVTDVNDHRPQLIPPLYSLNVSETANYGPSVVLAHFIVKDEDEGNNSFTTITITSGNSENKFAISDHDLILKDQLDYETTNFFELLLEITDHGEPPLRSSGRVRVKVLPENEAAPLMNILNFNVTIAENSPSGSLVYSAIATDTDNEIHGQITYSIDGNLPKEFALNPNSGQLFVNAPLDFDVLPNTYTVVIRATDGGGASDPATSTVFLVISLTDVNDNAPRCSSQLANMTVNENVPLGTQVGVVLATDADSKENGQVRYSQTGGNGNSYFSVDPSSGIVTTTNLIDYEKFESFYLSVMVSDGGKPSLISNCLIKVEVNNINDNYPVISPQDLTKTVPENINAGETVITYSVSDLDTAISSFSVVNPSQYFEVTFKNGNGAVRTKSSLAFATDKIHILYIQATDMATKTDSTIYTSTATLTVIVESVDHSLIINGNYNTSLPENTALSEIVFKINVTDKDGGSLANLTYDIIDGNIGGAFRIDSQGFVQVAGVLDRENVPTYLLTIKVVDQRTHPGEAETQAYIALTDINDNSPVFTPGKYIFTIAENSAVGFPVGTLQANDADIGANAKLTFAFDSFAVGKMSDFSLHPSSGVITVATSLNSKANPSYEAKVRATDSGVPVRFSVAQVIINIKENINHEPVFPQATYSASLDERAEPGTFILQVLAVDNDGGANGELSYFMDIKSLDGPVAKEYLQVDKTNGNIYSAERVDYEKNKELKIVVFAVDKGSPALAGNTTVIISIRDINDRSPIFGPKFYNTEVAYKGNCKNVIVTVTASDGDLGKNGELSYFLKTEAYKDLFEVASDTGELKLKNVALPNMGYKLEVLAKDAGQPIRTSAAPAKIRVDTFDPDRVIVTFRLGISKNAFLADEDKFIHDLEDVIHTKYPSAVVRLWCVLEYEGVAVVPAKSSRRLLADMPVDVNMYALRDNSTESEDNFDKDKDFVPQDEFLALFADNPEGDPNSNVQGEEWDYLNITNVKAYREPQGSSLAETYEMVFIILAIVIFLILFAIMICLLMRFCCRLYRNPSFKKQKLEHQDSIDSRNVNTFYMSYADSDIIKAKQKQNTETEVQKKSPLNSDNKLKNEMDPLVMMASSNEIHLPLPRFAVVKLHEKTTEDIPGIVLDKSYLRQSSDGSSIPPKNLQTLSSMTESSAYTTTSSPQAVVVTIKNPLSDFNKFNGKANDASTNKHNEYNSKTNKQQNPK